jgi:uncharacterized hydrophobic protein (TIGR00271 family)
LSIASNASSALETERDAVRGQIRSNAAFTRDYAIVNTLAAIIGGYGLLTNSVAVVIGAMVVASLTGPIIGMALALVDGDHPLMGSALLAELGGAFIVVSVGFLIGLLNLQLPVTVEMLARTQPNLFNLVIALAAGAAGTYATVSRSLSARIVGVAVSTALALPLATCGLLLARENISLAGGAFLLYLTNLVAIHIAAAVVLWLRGYRGLQRSGADWRGTLLHAGASVALLLALATGFAIDLDRVVTEQVFESRLRGELTQGLAAYPNAYLSDLHVEEQSNATVVIAIVYTPALLTPEQVKTLAKDTPAPPSGTLDLRVRSVLTSETTPNGGIAPTVP